MEIIIKKAETIEECKACNQMLTELISYEIPFDDQIVQRLNIEDHYERLLNKDDAIIFLGIYNGKIVGYVAAYKNAPKNSKECFVTIMNIFVKVEFRKMGIGNLLIKQVQEWAKEKFSISIIELDCYINNKSAMDFYSKLDFKPIRVKMRKEL